MFFFCKLMLLPSLRYVERNKKRRILWYFFYISLTKQLLTYHSMIIKSAKLSLIYFEHGTLRIGASIQYSRGAVIGFSWSIRSKANLFIDGLLLLDVGAPVSAIINNVYSWKKVDARVYGPVSIKLFLWHTIFDVQRFNSTREKVLLVVFSPLLRHSLYRLSVHCGEYSNVTSDIYL